MLWGSAFSIFGEHTIFIPDQSDYQAYGIGHLSFNLKNGWTLDNSYHERDWNN